MLKTFNVFSGLVFLACAALQWNDPDPLLWIVLYLLAAISCGLAFAHINAVKFNISIVAVYVVYAVYLFVAEDGVLSWMLDHQFESLTRSMMASAPCCATAASHATSTEPATTAAEKVMASWPRSWSPRLTLARGA